MVRKASGSEKKTIGGKLSAIYHKLVKLGHPKEVPDKLKKTAECTITTNITDADWKDILNLMILKSDALDKVSESTDKTHTLEMNEPTLSKVYNGLFSMVKASSINNKGAVKESFKAPFTTKSAYVKEQDAGNKAPEDEMDADMMGMCMNMRGMYGYMCNEPYPYGQPLSEEDIGKYLGQNDLTEFAEKYGINNFDDFMVFCDTMKTNLGGEDVETGVTQLKDAVFMAGLKYLFSFDNPLSEDAVRGMLDVMGRAFDDLGDCMDNSDGIKKANDQMKGMGMTEKTLNPENSQNSDNLTKNTKDEKNNNKDLTEVKEMESLEKVINMIKEKYETTEPVTPENLDVVVGKILAKNDELEGELENIKLTAVKESAKAELIGLGYEEKGVKETIDGCENEKEISKTLETMKKFTPTKVTEKTIETKEEKKEETKVEEKTEEGERKTVIEIEKKESEVVVSDENKNFKKIFNEIQKL